MRRSPPLPLYPLYLVANRAELTWIEQSYICNQLRSLSGDRKKMSVEKAVFLLLVIMSPDVVMKEQPVRPEVNIDFIENRLRKATNNVNNKI